MMNRIACLLVMAAFALAPLAQAVDCVMHVPAPAHEAHDHGHEHDTTQQMVVADCFSAAMHATMTGETMVKLPVFVVAHTGPAWPVRKAPRPALQLALAPWRGPPQDVLMTSQRRRI